jgi:mono/diheme cytochrome c family protein
MIKLNALRVALVAPLAALLACPVRAPEVRTASMSPELQQDYALFANRCSKCHSLARAFNQGDRDDEYWARYVTRMRLQPGSGIAPEEEEPILRFLRYNSAELRRERDQ